MYNLSYANNIFPHSNFNFPGLYSVMGESKKGVIPLTDLYSSLIIEYSFQINTLPDYANSMTPGNIVVCK